jgi:hypothetical protein
MVSGGVAIAPMLERWSVVVLVYYHGDRSWRRRLTLEVKAEILGMRFQ